MMIINYQILSLSHFVCLFATLAWLAALIDCQFLSPDDSANIDIYYPKNSEWKPAFDNLLASQPIVNENEIQFLDSSPANTYQILTSNGGANNNNKFDKIRYWIDNIKQEEDSSTANSLLEYLRNLKQANPDPDFEKNSYMIFDDENNPTISEPVNDPYDFNLATSANINDDLPIKQQNNATSETLDSLLSAYINKILLEHLRQKQTNPTEVVGRQEEEEEEESSQLTSDNLNQLINSRSSSLVNVNDNDDNDSDISQTGNNQDNNDQSARYGNSAGEYIDHPLAIIGHQYVQGGAGEGRQLLGPDGTFENVQVVKSDRAVPSYCDPPNPCPLGFTAEDGCIEKFVNSASFSREHQAKQKCSCDNEHSLFNCASPMSQSTDNHLTTPDEANTSSTRLMMSDQDEDKLNTLARTINNRFGSLDSIKKLISVGQTDNLD